MGFFNTGRVNYETVEEPDDQMTPTQAERPTRTNNKNIIAMTIALTFIVLAALSFSAGGRSSQKTAPAEPIMGLSKIRDCSLHECFMAGCDPSIAPFVCQIGGGCSVIPWDEPTCSDQCNLGACESKEKDIPASAESCAGAQCDEESCANYQKCGSSAPYQCLSGSAGMGCADDEYLWTIKVNDNVCSECCDTGTC
mmetsp:Transcript_10990/g.16615  ORF Transcript_10990/g.16615 Transcript_10990/m.16615 type:complete len:196 (+) Transcript_10990:112-699(+)|eukprot:CAMPEP_0203656406 /NCGR_PEP_ID=MMETSP0088-20131115/41500_1 /ASSEMBLY_ACC=CAM_ASM_001087 /TAXON_ID=426623 /ORGANISM="Chaetoceros affinis, Strain CCMP159" /LENGTH=195 /DNA_ID=CAMNT_0050517387 /DNA_START=82 /DNA_END=669 /DNA_ORIENTATION=+